MSLETAQVYTLTTEEKLGVLETLLDTFAPDLTEDQWPIDELDRRCGLVDAGEAKAVPLTMAMEEVRRRFYDTP